jgi:hypothetical protein
MASRQTILPIIRQDTGEILGAYNLGAFVNFNGTETTHTLPSTKVVNISKWTTSNPDPNVNPWFMAVLVDRAAQVSESYTGHAEFVSDSELAPFNQWSSPNGAPNLLASLPGTMLDTLSRKALAAVQATPNPHSVAVTNNVAKDDQVITITGATPSGIATQGTLPTGITVTLNGNKVRIAGTTTQNGTFPVVITVTANPLGDVKIPTTIVVAP